MTQEGQGPGPEDTPPLASTRWDAHAGGDDDALMPPYIPGKATPGGPAHREEAVEAPGPDTTAGRELEPDRLGSVDRPGDAPPAPPPPAPEEAWTAPDEAWPPAEEAAGAEVDTVGAEAAAGGQPGGDASEDDFPFDAFDIGVEAPEPPEEPTAVDLPSLGAPIGPHVDEPIPPDAALPADADEPAWDAGVIERAIRAEAGREGAAAELAARLERVAQRLRREGPAAVERELASADRFSALLAGVLAGYLAARND